MGHRVIFLDIDGVVNTLQISTKPFETTRGQIIRDGFYYKLNMPNDKEVSNEQAVMWLNKICKDANANIVITSTWRLGAQGLKVTEEALRNSGLLPEIKILGMTPITDKWDEYLGFRGKEIQMYLDNHPDITDFVIIDDDSDMGELKNRLVLTNTNVGITLDTYSEALELFKENETI